MGKDIIVNSTKVLEVFSQPANGGYPSFIVEGLDPFADPQSIESCFAFTALQLLAGTSGAAWQICDYPPENMSSLQPTMFSRVYIQMEGREATEHTAHFVPVFVGWETGFYPDPKGYAFCGWDTIAFSMDDEDLPQNVIDSAIALHAVPKDGDKSAELLLQEMVVWGTEKRDGELLKNRYPEPIPPWEPIALKYFKVVAYVMDDGNGLDVTCHEDAVPLVDLCIQRIAHKILTHPSITVDFQWSVAERRLTSPGASE